MFVVYKSINYYLTEGESGVCLIARGRGPAVARRQVLRGLCTSHAALPRAQALRLTRRSLNRTFFSNPAPN